MLIVFRFLGTTGCTTLGGPAAALRPCSSSIRLCQIRMRIKRSAEVAAALFCTDSRPTAADGQKPALTCTTTLNSHLVTSRELYRCLEHGGGCSDSSCGFIPLECFHAVQSPVRWEWGGGGGTVCCCKHLIKLTEGFQTHAKVIRPLFSWTPSYSLWTSVTYQCGLPTLTSYSRCSNLIHMLE